MKRKDFMNIVSKSCGYEFINNFTELEFGLKYAFPESKEEITQAIKLLNNVMTKERQNIKEIVDSIPFED